MIHGLKMSVSSLFEIEFDVIVFEYNGDSSLCFLLSHGTVHDQKVEEHVQAETQM